MLPRIPHGLLWSCPTWSASPTFRSLCCLAACWAFLWSAQSAKPSGSTSTAMTPGTWTSTVRVPAALAAHLIPHILSRLFISAYSFGHFTFLNASMCCVVLCCLSSFAFCITSEICGNVGINEFPVNSENMAKCAVNESHWKKKKWLNITALLSFLVHF